MTKGIRNIALIMVFSFVFLSLGLAYWQVVNADTMLDNPANRRAVFLEKRITRGSIYDRNGVVLAKTVGTGENKFREYPLGEMFQPLIGYATVQYGSAGLEATEAETLLGINDKSILRKIQNTFELKRTGNDVVLTLDARLQETAYEGLKGKTGAVVAIDPQNGDVLALVSQPSYDATTLEAEWDAILARQNSPLLNHAFSLFPPGSTMKIVTSGAIFRAGLDTTELFKCEGKTVINGQTIPEQNGKVHGWVNYDLALAYSCNTYFAQYGIKAGAQNFLKALSDFGFGQDIPFELYVPPSSVTNEDPLPQTLGANLLASSAFGQGEVMVSPFHMALITAGVANNGKIMAPHLIDSVLDSKQNRIYKRTPEIWLSPLSESNAEIIKSGMILAVNKGSAAPGALPDVQVAAKTGSAETGGNEDTHAWYVAFAPADDPKIAVAVLVEHGGTGSGAAAPIAKAVIEKALELREGEN
ncbi:penicillin-binding protein 2 [Dehalobacter sp. DCM]|uniref:peptidoglycan D,D-transpeptidase FtsI family protein n=1 Tax=Dehalobacter sp. DCM TaxID=2907827 RepID=UPI003081E7A8|nr:penicillin-binding protein 2 [Dehalobacter sp. DCM]